MSDQRSIRIEPSRKRVRVMFGGEVVADSRRPLLVWEIPFYPTYYFPEEDVRMELLAAEASTRQFALGEARLHAVEAGDREVQGAAYTYPDSVEPIGGHFAFVWRKMDHWFEEDEEVYVHPRDPYTRVDILLSSRHVRIEVDEVTVAETRRPTLLFETGLPVRYYLAKTDVRLDLLEPSDKTTECPYKGTAEYWSVVAGDARYDDLVWSYPFPTGESTKIAGLLCFYDEKVDIYVDGEKQERPQTAFS